jgi:hypothetical protein
VLDQEKQLKKRHTSSFGRKAMSNNLIYGSITR